MSHTVLHKKRDGGVSHNRPNPVLVELMMGAGLGWDAEEQAWRVKNLIVPVSTAAARAGRVTYKKAMAVEWVKAAAQGGLSEAAVLDLYLRRIQARYGYTPSAVVEFEALPYHIRGNQEAHPVGRAMCFDPTCHDRYFRNAVVWDDGEVSKCRCDMDLAREVHRDRMIAALGDTKARAFDLLSVSTPEELKGVGGLAGRA